ncbi:MAG TPA: 6-phospho-beta-glucosidase [Bryobacteraceae bacterium]|jgi:6-phospho-beta-glucosidase|nr:6-phospho-beta-glucosidase [Bryobacteraceae bacterium]
MSKVTIIGGGGVRTPLVIYGLAQAQLGVDEVVLFDIDERRTETIARLGNEVLRGFGQPFEIRISTKLNEAAAGAQFVLNSVRAGGMAARARDERVAIENGLAGQETTGPGGAAMALRTLPITLGHASIIEHVAPDAWFINFTNPAGLITQALTQNTRLRVIGICDTPMELFHRIAGAMGEPLQEMVFDYAGLNHLGWVRHVYVRGEDVTERLLNDANLLSRLYPSDLFDPQLVQALRLIPTEYLFFYYSQRRAYRNQIRAGATRGEELQRLNEELFRQLATEDSAAALQTYRNYLSRRNASYMKLEGQGDSVFSTPKHEEDPFETATGYHRIALDTMRGLTSRDRREVVLNVNNHGAIEDLESDDVVEVPCDLDQDGPRPRTTGKLPDSVRGLVLSVKAYERTIIKAALSGSAATAQLALLEYPIIAQWEIAKDIIGKLTEADREYLGYLH